MSGGPLGTYDVANFRMKVVSRLGIVHVRRAPKGEADLAGFETANQAERSEGW